MGKDLIGFDDIIFQVFSLPSKPLSERGVREETRKPSEHIPIGQLFKKILEGRS
jgi:hypothetical protein